MYSFRKFVAPTLAAAALSLISSAASADTYELNLVGSNGYVANWQMDSAPVLTDPADYGGGSWLVRNVHGYFNGLSVMPIVGFVGANYLGGVLLTTGSTAADVQAHAWGAQVFAGSDSAPVLMLGSYELIGSDFATTYELTISQVTAVPEPGSYALMLGGLGALGIAAARRRKS